MPKTYQSSIVNNNSTCENHALLLFWAQTGVGDEDLDSLALKNSIKQSIARQQYETFAALTFAAKAGDVEVVRDLIRRGANINAVDYDGRSAFAMVHLNLP